MNNHVKFVLAALILALFLGSRTTGQTTGLEAQMDEVVKLRIHRALQSTEETAAGLFVGKDRQNAYFITACHAVIQDDARVHSVELQFRNSPQKFKAVVFERYDSPLDLAVVVVPVESLPTELREIVRKDAEMAVTVHVIGHPAAGDWSVASGTVQNINSGSDIHHFRMSRDNSLAEGHSGGPAFDASGAFLGMHVESGPTYGVEAKSTEIVNQLAAWHVPTNNITSVIADKSDAGTGRQQAEQEAIDRVVDAYADSYSRRDAPALWNIWPGAPAETRQAIEKYFRGARSITMRVTNRKIESNGSKATVMAQSSQDFMPKNGSPQKAPESPITLELEKSSGIWLITLIR